MKPVSFILTLLLCISFLSTVYARAEEFSFELEKTFKVGKTENLLKLSNSSGEITIESHTQDEVIICATKIVRAKDQKEAGEVAERIGIDINQIGSTITVETEYPKIRPKGFWRNFLRFDWGDRAWVDYHILVPAKTKLDIHSASADVNVRGIESQVGVWVASGDVLLENTIGDVSANSASGNLEVYNVQGGISFKGASSDIKIRRSKGSINLTTASGDIYGEKLEGNLSVSQASGDLELYEINGDITAKGASGDKKIEQKQGNLKLNSSSGDIEAKTTVVPNKEYFIESASGDVKLFIPLQSRADIELRTASGNIDCKIPMELRIATAKKIKGKVNQGGPQITIETTSGDIFLFSQ